MMVRLAMRWLLILTLFIPSVVSAQVITGSASAVDGDSLEMTGFDIRLLGIDAPEAIQTCKRNGEDWACGQDAKVMLSALVEGKVLNCRQHGSDAYGRVVASCKAGRTDVAEALVRAGLAVALPKFSDAYVHVEAQAKARNVGIWASEFEMPADFRAANANAAPRVRQRSEPAPQRQSYSNQPTRGVYFRSCREAWAAGYAPMYRGEPGYRSGLDGDSDGIACEPFRGRR